MDNNNELKRKQTDGDILESVSLLVNALPEEKRELKNRCDQSDGVLQNDDRFYRKNIINSLRSVKDGEVGANDAFPEKVRDGNDESKVRLLSSNESTQRIVSSDSDKSLHVQFDEEDDPDDEAIRSTRSSRLSESSDSSGSSSSSSSTGSSDESIEVSEARPPDGGWGWVIVAASFVVNLIADGITFSFGVIFVEFLKYFGNNRAKTAWIGSLFMAMPLLSGPVASFLTDRYGCRTVTIAGSVLASGGFVISSMANSMEVLFLTFGILAGFGLSLCYVASVVIVAYYFDKRRSFATGLAVCGSGIGTFVFAPLTQVLLDTYGWRGTTLILAGLFLNLAVCGALMRDLPWTPSSRKSEERKRRKINKKRKSGNNSSADTFSVSNSTNTAASQHQQSTNFTVDNHKMVLLNKDDETTDINRLCTSLVDLPTFIDNEENVPIEVLELLTTNKTMCTALMHKYPNLMTPSRSFSDSGRLNESHRLNVVSVPSPLTAIPNTTVKNTTKRPIVVPQEKKIVSPAQTTAAYLRDLRIHRLSLTYRGAMLNINRYR